jgi:uncharacterized integral membrane protein
MPGMWLKIRVWTKLGLLGLVLLYALLFVFNNTGQTVTLWLFFGQQFQSSLLLAVVLSFLAGALLTMLVRTAVSTTRQIRQMKLRNEQERKDRELAELKAKAAMLQTRPEATDA